MNSKQYVIFLLFLIVLFSPRLSSGGEFPKSDFVFYIVDDGYSDFDDSESIDFDQRDADDDPHEPEELSSEIFCHEHQEYHDKPEKSDSRPIAVAKTEDIYGDLHEQSEYRDTSLPHEQKGLMVDLARHRPLWQSIVIDGSKILAGSCIFTGVTLLVLDYFAERATINEVLAQHNKTIATISSNDARLMHMAYRIDEVGLQTVMHQMIGKHGARIFTAPKRSWVIPAITQLYFDKEPTPERITAFMQLVKLAA